MEREDILKIVKCVGPILFLLWLACCCEFGFLKATCIIAADIVLTVLVVAWVFYICS